MDVAIALEQLVPAAVYGGSLTDNSQEAYDALRWEDDRDKPSWADVEAAWADYTPPPDPQDAFLSSIDTASTLAELKAALKGEGGRVAMAAARGKPAA